MRFAPYGLSVRRQTMAQFIRLNSRTQVRLIAASGTSGSRHVRTSDQLRRSASRRVFVTGSGRPVEAGKHCPALSGCVGPAGGPVGGCDRVAFSGEAMARSTDAVRESPDLRWCWPAGEPFGVCVVGGVEGDLAGVVDGGGGAGCRMQAAMTAYNESAADSWRQPNRLCSTCSRSSSTDFSRTNLPTAA
jgi:hypothetical protein